MVTLYSMNLNFTAKTFTTNKIAPVWNHLKGSPTLCCIGVCNDVVLIRVKFVVSRAKPWLHLLYCWNSPLLYIMFGNYCHYLTYFSENVLLVVKLLYGKRRIYWKGRRGNYWIGLLLDVSEIVLPLTGPISTEACNYWSTKCP